MTLYKPWAVGGYEMHRTSGMPVYVDGRKAGTAKVAVTRHYACDGPVNRVELTEFDGTLGEKHLNLIEALDEARNSAQYWKLKYSDVLDRDETINALKAEVERLKESRKEQAEKHRQKMRNLQQNFEQLANGKTRSTKLQKQLESSQNYNEHLKELISELQADLEKAEQQRQSVADQNVNLMAESGKLKRELQASKDYAQTLRKTIDRQTSEINSLNSKLRRERGNDSYWHEKYLENESALTTVRDAYRRVLGQRNELSRENSLLNKGRSKMVDDYNRLNNDINRFMKDFSEGATVINRAVDAWNSTVPE